MRKLLTLLCLLSLSIGICQTKEKQERNSKSNKSIKKPDEELKPYSDYVKSIKASQNKPTETMYSRDATNIVGTNTSYGKSKYDKEINWAADINPDHVEASLEKFRDEKRREEILLYIKIALSILGLIGLIYFAFKYFKSNKQSS